MNNRTVVFLLKCVHLYSENPLSHETARKILLDYSTKLESQELQRGREGVHGGFMKAVCNGDFFEAYQLADSINQEALQIGMDRYLKPEYMGEASNLYDDGIEPSDYLPETEDVKQ
jgi:hypothetical protein